jgi:hypothetical protein
MTKTEKDNLQLNLISEKQLLDCCQQSRAPGNDDGATQVAPNEENIDLANMDEFSQILKS